MLHIAVQLFGQNSVILSGLFRRCAVMISRAGFGVYLLLASLLRIKDVFFVKRTSVFDL